MIMPDGLWQKETFVDADDKTRHAMTFDMLRSIYDSQCKQVEVCNKRFKKIESRKIWDKTLAGITGLIGGFIAVLIGFKK